MGEQNKATGAEDQRFSWDLTFVLRDGYGFALVVPHPSRDGVTSAIGSGLPSEQLEH